MSHQALRADDVEERLSKLLNDLRRSHGPSQEPASEIAQMDIMLSYLVALKSAIDHRLLALAKQRNSLLPVNKLPAELVTDIIQISLEIDSSVAQSTTLWTLSSVQTRWWQQIAQSARFWTDLHVDDNSALTELKLERSRNALLAVNCGEDAPDKAVRRFLETVAPHSHRWSSFSYGGPHARSIIKTYLETELPELERLKVESDVKQRSFAFVGGPKLRHVEFGKIYLENWTILHNLQTLSISDISVPFHFQSSILHVLASSPALERLELNDLISSDMDLDDNSLPDSNILLPRLKLLQLVKIPVPLAVHILRFLQAPNVGSICISSDDLDGASILSELVELRGTVPSIMSRTVSNARIEDVEMQVGNRAFYLEATRENHASVLVSIAHAPSFVAQFGHLLPFAGPTSPYNLCLAIDGPYSPFSAGAVSPGPLFDIFPTTSTIQLRAAAALALDVIQAASQPHAAEEGSEQWVLPKLHKVEFATQFVQSFGKDGRHWTEVMGKLSRMIENRRTSGLLSDIAVYDHASNRAVDDVAAYPLPHLPGRRN